MREHPPQLHSRAGVLRPGLPRIRCTVARAARRGRPPDAGGQFGTSQAQRPVPKWPPTRRKRSCGGCGCASTRHNCTLARGGVLRPGLPRIPCTVARAARRGWPVRHLPGAPNHAQVATHAPKAQLWRVRMREHPPQLHSRAEVLRPGLPRIRCTVARAARRGRPPDAAGRPTRVASSAPPRRSEPCPSGHPRAESAGRGGRGAG
jgi:hypothetical protein